jgi:hypothetical protein
LPANAVITPATVVLLVTLLLLLPLLLLFVLQWQPPPDPEPFVPCQPDVAAGAAQLQQLGLLGLLLEQHTEHHAPLLQQQQQ